MANAATALPDPLADLPQRVVFFDGVCSFCDQTVGWLIERDPAARLRFAPLQGQTAERVRSAFPGAFPEDLDTLVYLLPGDDGRPELRLRSAAVLQLLREIGGPWAALAWLRFLPRPLMDWLYRGFARNRYRWFGKLEACRLPSEDERSRTLP